MYITYIYIYRLTRPSPSSHPVSVCVPSLKLDAFSLDFISCQSLCHDDTSRPTCSRTPALARPDPPSPLPHLVSQNSLNTVSCSSSSLRAKSVLIFPRAPLRLEDPGLKLLQVLLKARHIHRPTRATDKRDLLCMVRWNFCSIQQSAC